MKADLGYQLDYIWNQLKPKRLGTPVRDFLNQIIWSKETYPKSGPHLLEAACIKDHRRAGETAQLLQARLTTENENTEDGSLPFYPLTPTLTDRSVHIPFLVLEPTTLGFQCRRKIRSLLELQYQIGTAETSSLMDRTATRFPASPSWDNHYWATRLCAISQSNKYPLNIVILSVHPNAVD